MFRDNPFINLSSINNLLIFSTSTWKLTVRSDQTGNNSDCLKEANVDDVTLRTD